MKYDLSNIMQQQRMFAQKIDGVNPERFESPDFMQSKTVDRVSANVDPTSIDIPFIEEPTSQPGIGNKRLAQSDFRQFIDGKKSAKEALSGGWGQGTKGGSAASLAGSALKPITSAFINDPGEDTTGGEIEDAAFQATSFMAYAPIGDIAGDFLKDQIVKEKERNTKYGQIDDVDKGIVGGEIAESTAKWTARGATFGPIGAGVGAVVGGALGALQGKAAKKKAKKRYKDTLDTVETRAKKDLQRRRKQMYGRKGGLILKL